MSGLDRFASLPPTKGMLSTFSQSSSSRDLPSLGELPDEDTKSCHDCELAALNLLRSLHQWPRQSAVPIKNGDSTPGTFTPPRYASDHAALDAVVDQGGDDAPGLDKILYANKCALAGVRGLLDSDCGCAQRPHVASLCVSIIMKMLALYKSATVIDGSDGPGTPRDPSTAVNGSGSTTRCFRPSVVRSTVIQVGLFSLDEEDQAMLQQGILLRELRKIDGALERFAALANNAMSAPSGGQFDASVRQWFSVATVMMKRELQRILQPCRDGLFSGT